MAQRPIRTTRRALTDSTRGEESDDVEAMDTVKPSRGVKPPAGVTDDSTAAEDATGQAPTAPGPTTRVGTVGQSTVAGSTATGVGDRAAELAGTLDSRIRESVPQAKDSSFASSSSSGQAAAGISDDVVSDSSPVAGAGGMPTADASAWTWDARIGGGTGSVGSAAGTDESSLELARETLAATGRYDDVDDMSEQELAEALADEATRAFIGYEGPVDASTAAGWAQAEAAAQHEQQMRDYLISEGYDPAEVNMMDSETLALYTEAEAEVILAGGEGGAPSGPGGGPQGGSMNLSDRDSGTTQVGSDQGSGSSADESASSGGGGQPTSTSDGEGEGDDDDDDGDDDGNDGATTADTDATGAGEDESSGNEQGSGAAPASSTPHPDHDSYNPAEKAAFLGSKVGAGSRESDMDAIGHARGGGLIVGGEDPGDRRAWFESDMSGGERDLAATSVSMRRGGGVTDPVDGDEASEGLSDIDASRLPNFGLVDPADHGGGGGTPVDPITGLPAPLPNGPVSGDLGATLRSIDLGGAGDLADGLEIELDVDDLDLDT